MLALNINPAAQRAAERGSRMQEKCLNPWHWSGTVAKKMVAEYRRSRACPSEEHVFPTIGHLPVTELKSRHFIELLKGIEEKGFV